MGILKRSGTAAVAIGAALGAGALGVVPASAASALPVSFSASNGATVHYNSDGNIVVNTANGGTGQVFVDLKALGDTSIPQTPPSFTVDKYTSRDPSWTLQLSDGTTTRTVIGWPVQADGTANFSFTGDQWIGSGGTSGMVTYQQALAQACPTLSACHVAWAFIDDTNTDTLSKLQYNGETAPPGIAITVSPVAAQTLTAVESAAPVQVKATTTTAPGTLTYSDNGTLPSGLTIDPGTGVISGTPAAAAVGTSTATITVTDAAGDTASTTISYTVKQAPASGICSASTGCAWQRLTNPSSMVMDVNGATPSTGTPIIAYAPKAGDPAADFTAVPSGFGPSEQLTYTPYGTRQTAEADNATLAAAAYNSDGSAKYCVSSVADVSGQALQLRPCATTANQWQDFVHAGDAAGGSMIEPTYGSPGISAGSSPMAINDKANGGDGTPLINYAATGTGNELFTPGI